MSEITLKDMTEADAYLTYAVNGVLDEFRRTLGWDFRDMMWLEATVLTRIVGNILAPQRRAYKDEAKRRTYALKRGVAERGLWPLPKKGRTKVNAKS